MRIWAITRSAFSDPHARFMEIFREAAKVICPKGINFSNPFLRKSHRHALCNPDFKDMMVLWIISAVNGQDKIEITVNGEAHQVNSGARVTDLIKHLELAQERLAIELNLSILPRLKWAETELRSGDKLEIV